jgi:hypothetical protein
VTQRERIPDAEVQSSVGVYETTRTTGRTTTRDDADTVVLPGDEVRWGPVIAGLFTAITTLLGLSVLGLAIGLSSFNANDPLGNFGIGAGIWGAISALIAFGLGGYMAGGTGAFRGTNSGLLNGALVWIVAIPLLLWLLGSGIGALFGTVSAAVGTAATAAGNAAANPELQATAQAGAAGAAGALQATAQAIPGQITPGDVNNAADTAGRTAWGTLLWLGLGAAAAMLGGWAGGRNTKRDSTIVRAA